ncbi:hypothetical protein DB346_07075 [Verrucomicrobia bacterium LW23]|nr:hypothetical protein DB346_07075 [Verrucomicrobia bacterium LW23]
MVIAMKDLIAAPSRKSRSRRGFSLAEVVLSLGVVSFAMVSILGMLPVGLSMFNKARNYTVEAQIVQAISNDILLTDFVNLAALADQTYYFDDSGKPLATATENVEAQKVFAATVRLKSLNGNDVAPVNLQSSANGTLTDEAYNVQIVIENKTMPRDSRTYSVLVANNNNNQP